MRDEEWSRLTEEELERLLVERWLYRGMLLGVVLLAAIAVTYLGLRGVTGVLDRITVAALVALALAAGAVAFHMRLQDLKIYRELRRRPPRAPRSPER